MRKTKCKVLSCILTLVFLLANVPILAQTMEDAALTISHTRFADGNGAALTAVPAEGTDILTTVGVRKSGAAAVKAALYLAQYDQNGKLTAIDTTVQDMNVVQDERLITVVSKVAAGTQALKALLWNGDNQSPMICAGNYPVADGGIEAVYIDGALYDQFNNNTFSYYYQLSGNTLPKVTAVTKDNSVKAEVSYTYGNEPTAVITTNSETYTIYFEMNTIKSEITNLQLLTDATQTIPKAAKFEIGAYMYSDYDVNPTKITGIQENDAFSNCYFIQPGSDWEKNAAWVGEDNVWYSFDINQTAEIYVLAGGYAPTGIQDDAVWAAMKYVTVDQDGKTQDRNVRTFRYDVPVKPGEKKTVTISNMGKGPNGEQYQNPLLVLVKFKEFFNFQNNGSIQPGGDAQRVEWQKRLMYDANLQVGSKVAWDRMVTAGWGYHEFDYVDPVLLGGSFVRIANDSTSFPTNSDKDKEGISFDVTTDVDVYLLYRDMIKPAFVDEEGSGWEFTQNTTANGFAHSIVPESGKEAYIFKGMAHRRFNLGDGQSYQTINLPNTGYIAVVKKDNVLEPAVINLKYHGPQPDASTGEDGNPIPGYKNAARFVKGIQAGDLAYQDRENVIMKEITDQLGFTDAYYLQTQLDNKNTGNADVYNYYAEPDKTWFTFQIDAPADVIMLTTGGYVPPAIEADKAWIRQAPLGKNEYYADIQTISGPFQDKYNTMHIKSVAVAPGETQTVTIPTMGKRVDIPIILVRFK